MARQSTPVVRPGTAATTKRMTGGQALIECLRRAGVEIVFGHPGGQALPLYDSIYDARGIRHVLVRHEQVAAHAATGYHRVTGKVGVCMATSGPGATNLVTGITDAMMDSAGIVAITGQVSTYAIGSDAFQEADIMGITTPVTKHNMLVQKASDLPQATLQAFLIAGSGRPGPVLVDIPRDVALTEGEFEFPEQVTLRSGKIPPAVPSPNQIAAAAALLSRASRPIIYAGGGVITSNAAPELTAMARRTRIPVTTTLMGKGAFPETDPLALGMLGMHGTAYANYAINGADVILAIGARFDDRVTGRVSDFAPAARFIHIDIDPAEIGKNKPAHVPIVGDAKEALRALDGQVTPPDCEAWHRQIAEWKTRYPLRYRQAGEVIKPQFAIEELYRATEGKAVVVTDVGQHQMWAAQFYLTTEPRTWLSSGGLGTMGFGFPAALGAQIGQPDALVCVIAGDGSFQMTLQDLATAVEWSLPLKIYILDNQALGMVRQWQQLFYRERYSHVFLKNPDFARLAEAYGAVGINVRRAEEVRPAIRRSLEVTDRPCVVAISVDPEENCYPMIPSGQSVKEMIIEDDRVRG
ncbi:MAG TPA: biosynthetic-type acetolactate synthase large subunit [bacterium]|nr:biosynthetic-type acetolactate synthase large subunit [bacterium]